MRPLRHHRHDQQASPYDCLWCVLTSRFHARSAAAVPTPGEQIILSFFLLPSPPVWHCLTWQQHACDMKGKKSMRLLCVISMRVFPSAVTTPFPMQYILFLLLWLRLLFAFNNRNQCVSPFDAQALGRATHPLYGLNEDLVSDNDYACNITSVYALHIPQPTHITQIYIYLDHPARPSTLMHAYGCSYTYKFHVTRQTTIEKRWASQWNGWRRPANMLKVNIKSVDRPLETTKPWRFLVNKTQRWLFIHLHYYNMSNKCIL